MRHAHDVTIDAGRCIGCGLCTKDCPAANIRLENQTTHDLTQACILCGHCVAICPKAAVSTTGFDEPAVEITGPVTLDPQTLLSAIRTRRSIRQFTGREVPPQVIAQIIEAGRLTPTGKNAQDVSWPPRRPWRCGD